MPPFRRKKIPPDFVNASFVLGSNGAADEPLRTIPERSLRVPYSHDPNAIEQIVD